MERYRNRAMARGSVLDKSGHILTTYTWWKAPTAASKCNSSNKHRYSAKVIGTDKTHDPRRFCRSTPPICNRSQLADSSQLSVGQKVYAIGNLFDWRGPHDARHHQFHPVGGAEGAPIEDATSKPTPPSTLAIPAGRC